MADKNSSTAPVPHEVPFIGASQDNAEAKPKRRRAAKIKAVPPAPAIGLTGDEMRVAMLYRSMDDRRRWEMLQLAEMQAARHQRHVASKLRLRLVVSITA